MRADDDADAGSPTFSRWVSAREHTLQRFTFLLTGDRAATGRVLDRTLRPLHQSWRDVVDTVDLDLFVRREILRVLGSRHRHDPRATDAEPVPPSPDDDLPPVWEAFSRLPLEQRAALALRHHEQMDTVDVAEVLGCSVADAEGYIDAGVTSVRSELERQDRPLRDADSLLRQALGEYADRAPAEEGRAGVVVAGARRRRRRQGAVGVLVAVAVLVPFAWLASPADEEPAALAPGVPLAEVPDLRWESYADVEVQVPETWGYGDLTQWCAPDGSPGRVEGPAVDRPGTGATVVCSASSTIGTRGVQRRPTYTAGLLLRPAGEGPRIGRADVAPGAAVYRRRVGQVELTVVDVLPELANRILSSATVVRDTDRNGCRPSAVLPRMGRYLNVSGGGLEALSEPDAVSICHYEVTPWERPTLVFSEQEGAADAELLLRAMGSAAPTDAQAAVEVTDRCAETEAALVRFWSEGSGTDVWVHYAGCGPYGVDDGRRARELRRDVLHPVLDPPWRGAVGAGAPWPGAG